MNWGEESEKPPSFLTKTENQRLNWRKPANRARHQNRKIAIIKSENRKTESKIGQIRKTENPNAPLVTLTAVVSGLHHHSHSIAFYHNNKYKNMKMMR